MAKAVIAYDKDLPEIPGRRPWEKPTSFLVKDDAAPTGWREDGPRPPTEPTAAGAEDPRGGGCLAGERLPGRLGRHPAAI